MKSTLATIILLTTLACSAAFAQSTRIWTNADLGKPLSSDRPTVTAEQLRTLADKQFRWTPTPERLDGPRIVILRSSPTAGPYGEFSELRDRRLDGSDWSDPPFGWMGGYGFWPGLYGGSMRPGPRRRGGGRPSHGVTSFQAPQATPLPRAPVQYISMAPAGPAGSRIGASAGRRIR